MSLKVGDRVRVYCMHGHWDGTITQVIDDMVTANQPKRAQRMLWVEKLNAVGLNAGGSWQHPKQCRKLKKTKAVTITKALLAKAFDKSHHYPHTNEKGAFNRMAAELGL